MTRSNIDNIKAVYQLATLTEQQEGITWYPTADQIAISLADRYEISEAQAIQPDQGLHIRSQQG